MLFGKKSGFTLIELLVVMSIIAILAAALITQVTSMRETARSMKCKANLRTLAQAALNYGVDHSIMPWAGSHEDVNAVRSSSGFITRVDLRRGWVDWTSKGGSIEGWPKPYSSGASFSSKGTIIAAMDDNAGYLSVTNGSLWSYAGKDFSTYVCEAHKAKVKNELKSVKQVYRSYFMNGYFGYNKDYYPVTQRYRDVYLNNLSARGSAATLLLFAEMPIKQTGVDELSAVDGVIETVIVGYNDGADTKAKPQREILGFNHMVGKRYVAHVAYADGHVDVFHTGASSLTVDQMRGLTYYLCNGYDLPKNTSEWKIP
jgi:prepilin-type N-terminal cleavage/methylation domain-containing protein/prepilin-type processing-associated H-X9-DG protein